MRFLQNVIRPVLVLLVVSLFGLLLTVHIKWWPWLMDQTHQAQYDAKTMEELRLSIILQDEMHRRYAKHAMALMSIEKIANKDDQTNRVNSLIELPGVQDAFRLDLNASSGFSVRGLITTDTLLMRLDRRKKSHPFESAGGRAQMMRRLVGGSTRFRDFIVDGRQYSVLIRYMNTYYPEIAVEAVGVVLDKKWYVEQIPSLLDSLARDNTYLLFFAPEPPDTSWMKDEDPFHDPFAGPGGSWKQTLGVKDGKDTLWWYGNRNMQIFHGYDEQGNGPGLGYINDGTEPFGLDILVKVDFPIAWQEIENGKKSAKTLFPLIEGGTILLIMLLFASYLQINRRHARNQIALAHLAHAVKTPVARLKLAAETLTEGRVASPEEERGMLKAVTRECDRLDRAVQNAALSLEKGKREYNLQEGDLVQVVQELVESWRPSFDNLGIELKLDVAGGQAGTPVVRTKFDREMMIVAFDNLIDNALRHTRLADRRHRPAGDGMTKNVEDVDRHRRGGDGGMNSVTISLRSESKEVILTVDDSGAGIPKSERSSLFKPFAGSVRDPKTGVTGLGLGLALVKKIIEGHKGKIEVGESPQGGARFTVKLPELNN